MKNALLLSFVLTAFLFPFSTQAIAAFEKGLQLNSPLMDMAMAQPMNSEVLVSTYRQPDSANFTAIFESGATEEFRDKLNIIQKEFVPGIVLQYYPNQINLTKQNSLSSKKYFGFDQDDNPLFQVITIGKTHKESNLKITGAHIYGIIDIQNNSNDCMPEDPSVCHPFITTHIGDTKHARGDLFVLQNGDTTLNLTITDAHTYSNYNGSNEHDYARIEFLIKNKTANTEVYTNESSQFCKFTTNESGNISEQCSLRGKIAKAANALIDRFKRKEKHHDTYIMC